MAPSKLSNNRNKSSPSASFQKQMSAITSNNLQQNTNYNVLAATQKGNQQERISKASKYRQLRDQLACLGHHIILAEKSQRAEMLAILQALVSNLNSTRIKTLGAKRVETIFDVLTGNVQLIVNSGVSYLNLHGEGNKSKLVVSYPDFASRFSKAKMTAFYFLTSSHSKLQHVKNAEYRKCSVMSSDPTQWHPFVLWFNSDTNQFAVKEVTAEPKKQNNAPRTIMQKSLIENDENSGVIHAPGAKKFLINLDFSVLNIPNAKLKLTYESVKLVN